MEILFYFHNNFTTTCIKTICKKCFFFIQVCKQVRYIWNTTSVFWQPYCKEMWGFIKFAKIVCFGLEAVDLAINAEEPPETAKNTAKGFLNMNNIVLTFRTKYKLDLAHQLWFKRNVESRVLQVLKSQEQLYQ